MTRSLPFYICAAAALLLAPTPRSAAQAVALPSPTPALTATAPSAPKQLTALKVTRGPMKAAVAELLDALKRGQVPEVNVLFEAGAEEIPVPELNLRNVTGPDALRLIAVSAGCEAEPIQGEPKSWPPIGYIIRQGGSAPYVGGNTLRQSGSVPPLGFEARVTPSAKPGAPRTVPPRVESGPAAANSFAPISPSATASLSVENPPGALPSGRAVLNLTSSSPAVRVYSLGDVVAALKFPEIEATLKEVLKADGLASDAAKFALHEKTKVLVATGTARVHELIAQLLEALRKNEDQATARSRMREEMMQDVAELKAQLRAEQSQRENIGSQMNDQRKMMSDQLAKAEAQRQELERELAKLKAASGKPAQ